MKNKILNIILTLLICIIIAPAILYALLSTSSFEHIVYLVPKKNIVTMYIFVSLLGLIIYKILTYIKNSILYRISKSPVIRSEIISIEKVSEKSLSLGFVEIGYDSEDVYVVKFKHKNQLINITIPKDDVEKDLPKNENPYIEYQYIKCIRLFNKFKNIKVHTNKNRV
ncbi:hypothetical protein [Clostridium guangxiense]|uniref:hypothetical protein n=1 Tax=Clostridium guangxiense TaxID=1662055 RepID=UPI001E440305|nr:hypothetical protein [Clostridium guangxiense]MCD2346478.1 hypothetical protein [Clostridium guangxiense]